VLSARPHRRLRIRRDEILLRLPHLPQHQVEFGNYHAVAVQPHVLEHLNPLLYSSGDDAERLGRGDVSSRCHDGNSIANKRRNMGHWRLRTIAPKPKQVSFKALIIKEVA
jgi:hypothetical protein